MKNFLLKKAIFIPVIFTSYLFAEKIFINEFNNIVNTKIEKFKPIIYKEISKIDSLQKNVEEKLNIKFEKINITTTQDIPSIAGIYFNDTIKINEQYFFFKKTEKEKHIMDFLGTASLDFTIYHEIGHDYTFEIMENLEKENKLNKQTSYFIMEHILEGIAQYFAFKMEDKELPKITNLTMDDYFSNEYKTKYLYMPQVIAPILEKYGTRGGIEKILTSEYPKLEEFPSLDNYKKRLLE